jgi:hypothetical protein
MKLSPDCPGRTISHPDVAEKFFPRFQVASGCYNLQLGTLLRGLRQVKQTDYYADRTGKRCSVTVYCPILPPPSISPPNAGAPEDRFSFPNRARRRNWTFHFAP